MDFSPRIDSWSADEVGAARRLRRRRGADTPDRPDGPDDAGRSPARTPTSFRRAFAVTVGVLILLCAALVVVAHGRGPTLASTQVDAASVTTTPHQQLRVFTDESVAQVRKEQVRMTPAAPLTVQTAGTVITVQFTGRLRSATRYSVELRGVTSVFGSRPATLTTAFTTARASVLTLDRAPGGGQDRIVRSRVGVPGRTVAYRAPGIQAFGALGSDLVVVRGDGHASTISIVAADGTTEDLILPGTGLVRSFALDAPTGLVAFTWTPASEPRATPRLFTIDLEGQHTSTAVTGAAARAAERLLAVRPGSLTTRGTARLAGDGSSVTLTASAGSRPVTLTRALAGQRLTALGTSPNGQYVSVVSAPADAPSDGRALDPAPRSPTTLVVDVDSGATVASFAGSSLAW
ncbi:hypothetical protein [Frondihabitans peucedani]|uniref:SbsA Ig-like domain-containing protein n=1 Tax=Frondihabitans peucedani TaxID=598626 RepID=A0ABP8E127_9MICO